MNTGDILNMSYQINSELRAENEALRKRCKAMRKEVRALRVELANMRLNRIHAIRGEG